MDNPLLPNSISIISGRALSSFLADGRPALRRWGEKGIVQLRTQPLYAHWFERTAAVRDAHSHAPIARLRVPGYTEIHGLELGPSEELLFGWTSGAIYAWDMRTHDLVGQRQIEGRVVAVCVVEDDVLVGVEGASSLQVLHGGTLVVLEPVPLETKLTGAARLAAVHGSRGALLFDLDGVVIPCAREGDKIRARPGPKAKVVTDPGRWTLLPTRDGKAVIRAERLATDYFERGPDEHPYVRLSKVDGASGEEVADQPWVRVWSPVVHMTLLDDDRLWLATPDEVHQLRPPRTKRARVRSVDLLSSFCHSPEIKRWRPSLSGRHAYLAKGDAHHSSEMRLTRVDLDDLCAWEVEETGRLTDFRLLGDRDGHDLVMTVTGWPGLVGWTPKSDSVTVSAWLANAKKRVWHVKVPADLPDCAHLRGVAWTGKHLLLFDQADKATTVEVIACEALAEGRQQLKRGHKREDEELRDIQHVFALGGGILVHAGEKGNLWTFWPDFAGRLERGDLASARPDPVEGLPTTTDDFSYLGSWSEKSGYLLYGRVLLEIRSENGGRLQVRELARISMERWHLTRRKIVFSSTELGGVGLLDRETGAIEMVAAAAESVLARGYEDNAGDMWAVELFDSFGDDQLPRRFRRKEAEP